MIVIINVLLISILSKGQSLDSIYIRTTNDTLIKNKKYYLFQISNDSTSTDGGVRWDGVNMYFINNKYKKERIVLSNKNIHLDVLEYFGIFGNICLSKTDKYTYEVLTLNKMPSHSKRLNYIKIIESSKDRIKIAFVYSDDHSTKTQYLLLIK